VETDGAQAAKAFTANNQTYLFIVNGGSVGRYETKSRLYRVSSNGTLTVVCHPLLFSWHRDACNKGLLLQKLLCQRNFCFLPGVLQIQIRTARFLQVFAATENSLCLLFNDNAAKQLYDILCE